MKTGHPWTPAEDSRLRARAWAGWPAWRIAMDMGRTQAAVVQRGLRIGITVSDAAAPAGADAAQRYRPAAELTWENLMRGRRFEDDPAAARVPDRPRPSAEILEFRS